MRQGGRTRAARDSVADRGVWLGSWLGILENSTLDGLRARFPPTAFPALGWAARSLPGVPKSRYSLGKSSDAASSSQVCDFSACLALAGKIQ